MQEPSIVGWITGLFGAPEGWVEAYSHVVTAAFVVFVLTAAGIIVWARLRNVPRRLIPEGRITLTNLFEIVGEAVLELMKDMMGPKAKKHLPLIGSLFIYIMVSDLIGIIPGFRPPTENINTNLACALVVFFYYNYVGIKEQGLKRYMKELAGPVIWLAPLIFLVELSSHLIRPASLSIRLMGNISGDHIVVGIFSQIVPFLVPIIFMGLAVFISVMQAFVFTLLSIVYIQMASGHGDH